MAVEVVGLAASLASLLEISGKIVTAGYGYISKVAHAPSRMRMVLSEVSSMDLVLGRLEECSVHQSASGGTSILYTLFRNGVFKDCAKVLKKIDGTVQTCMAESEAQSSKREVKAIVKRVVWPMKEKETEEILRHLDRLRSILSDAIAQDSAASLHRLESSTQELHQTTTKMANSHLHAELMAWVCPYHIDPFDNYSAALKRRQPGTGSWLVTSDDFNTWLQCDHGLFWLRGLPGCGKTVLTSTVVEHIQRSLVPKNIGVALAYFYIDYRDPAKQGLDCCLATIVRQMIDQNLQGIKQLEELREQKQRSFSRNLTAGEYIGIIKMLADMQTKVYIVIDALDEAPDPEPFVDAFSQLSSRECGTPIVMLVSSRNSTNLENLLMPVATKKVLVSSDENDDVRQFITTEVDKRFTSKKLNVPNGELIDLTKSKLIARADGLFQQANLLVDFVFAGNTSRSVRKALTELPNGLEETYETILRRTTSQNRRHLSEIKRSLQWLSGSFLPLTPKMLVEAAAIDPDDLDLDTEACMDELDLIGMLSSLVLVDWNTTPPIVSLAHQTVHEYLQSQSILQSDMSYYHIDVPATHQYLAETLIQYLQFPGSASSMMQAARNHHDPFVTTQSLTHGVAYSETGLISLKPISSLFQQSEIHSSSPSRLDTAIQNAVNFGPCVTHASGEQALLNYAANLWPEHLNSGKYALEGFKQTIAPKLWWYLNPTQDSGSLYQAWEAFQRRRLSSSIIFRIWPLRTSNQQAPLFQQLLKILYFSEIGHETTTQTPFFYTILFGIDGCFDILSIQYDVNQKLSSGWTPLTVAAGSGSFSIAQKLLESGANVNKAADLRKCNGKTPLHIAAELAREDLVKLFLAHGASTMSLTATMTTPFYRAVQGGSAEILQSLYEAGSDVNAPNRDNYTPLMEAVRWSNYDLLDLLLSWGADPYFQNDYGDSAITKASKSGDEGVVEMLESASLNHLPKPTEPATIQYRDAMMKALHIKQEPPPPPPHTTSQAH